MTEQAFYWCVKVLRQNQKVQMGGAEVVSKMVIDQSIRDLGLTHLTLAGLNAGIPSLKYISG